MREASSADPSPEDARPARASRDGSHVGGTDHEVQVNRRKSLVENILRLSAGDFVAKTLYFFAFIYLARVLGVSSYGLLEFALSILSYLVLMADGGLELWGIRQAARGADLKDLVARIVPLRALLALATYGVLLALLIVLPSYPNLRIVLLIFGVSLFAQAVDLKWVYMGSEKMTSVAAGLILSQLIFVAAVFVVVRAPQHLIWVPVFRLAADLGSALFFAYRFVSRFGNVRLSLRLRSAREILGPSLTMGVSRTLAHVNYNFDSVLIGLMLGVSAVGWYGAAYKPITAILAMPVTYFLGLFPALSRTHHDSPEQFCGVVVKSLHVTSIVGAPIGVAGVFLAAPIIDLLYGQAYRNSVPAFQILSWSAALVIIRGTYRQALNAAGRPRLDLTCAVVATIVNLGLNLALIPTYGIVGAAAATVVSEVVWLVAASIFFSRAVAVVGLTRALIRPLIAAGGMAGYFALTFNMPWLPRALTAASLYAALLVILHPKIWLPRLRGRTT